MATNIGGKRIDLNEDVIINPLKFIDEILEKSVEENGIEALNSSCFDTARFVHLLSNGDASSWTEIFHVDKFANKIFSLNTVAQKDLSTAKIPNRSLVKFRGMIQDCSDDFCYSKLCYEDQEQKRHYVVYRDDPIDSEVKTQGMVHIKFLMLVPCPGECDWVRFPNERRDANGPERGGKGGSSSSIQTEEEMLQKLALKRPLEIKSNFDPFGADFVEVLGSTPDSCSMDNVRPELRHILPWEQKSASPCVTIQIYGEGHEVLLHQVVEVIGVVSHEPQSTSIAIHALGIEAFPQGYNPYASLISKEGAFAESKKEETKRRKEDDFPYQVARNKLVEYFTMCLKGDELAAEYLFLALSSSQFARADGLCLGNLSLILSVSDAETNDFGPRLCNGLRRIFPSVCRIPITVDLLNGGEELKERERGQEDGSDSSPSAVQEKTTSSSSSARPLRFRFCPYKDVNGNRMVSGMLEIPVNTVCLFDETRLEEGLLTNIGIDNLKEVRNVLNCKQLLVPTGVYAHPFNIDPRFLVLTDESKSLTAVDADGGIQLPLKEEEGGDEMMEVDDDDNLEFLRLYIAKLLFEKSPQNVQFIDSVRDIAVSRFVKERNSSNWEGLGNFIDGKVFDCWARIARAHALSVNATCITPEIWSHVIETEMKRLERMKEKILLTKKKQEQKEQEKKDKMEADIIKQQKQCASTA